MSSKEEAVDGGNGNCFYVTEPLLSARLKQTMRNTRRSVDRVPSCFRKIQRFLSCHSSLFSIINTVTVSSTLRFFIVISFVDLTD